MQPETRYADSGGVNIAYQVLGDGPRDLVFVMGWVSTDPAVRRYAQWTLPRIGARVPRRQRGMRFGRQGISP